MGGGAVIQLYTIDTSFFSLFYTQVMVPKCHAQFHEYYCFYDWRELSLK